MQLVGTAVLRGCRRAPRPRLGRRLRVDLIVQSNLADRHGLAGHRGGRRVVWGGSGEPLTTRSKQSQANHSWNHPFSFSCSSTLHTPGMLYPLLLPAPRSDHIKVNIKAPRSTIFASHLHVPVHALPHHLLHTMRMPLSTGTRRPPT